MMIADIKDYLPNDILVKVDRAAMSNSLETRIPFLDPKVTEFAMSLPQHHKIYKGQGKRILRDILYKYVPKNLIERPKSGFGMPIDSWLREPLKDWVQDTLNSKKIKNDGLINHNSVEKILDDHMNKKINKQHELWNILTFQCWLNNA